MATTDPQQRRRALEGVAGAVMTADDPMPVAAPPRGVDPPPMAAALGPLVELPPRPEGWVRKPFGDADMKLNYPNREGYHRHWFNDTPGRLMQAWGAGYDQVHDPHGRPVHMVVGISQGGVPLVAYLLEVPLQWYLEDRAKKDARVIDLLQQIGRGDYTRPKGPDGDARYMPQRDEIVIRSGASERR